MALQVWLPLTKDLRNQGVNNVNFTNSGATYSSTGGKLGGTYSFNGSSRLEATLPTSISSSVGSLACWVKFDSLPASTAWYNLIQLGAAGGFAASRLSLYYEYGTGINISIDGSSTGQNYIAYTFSTNTWYHIACTNDGTTVKVYINGSQILSKTATKGSYTTAATKIYCGGPTNYYLKGSMNDARYYDHALSPLEVKYIAQGLVLHYPLNRNGWGQENLLSGNNAKITTWTNYMPNSVILSGDGYDNKYTLIKGIGGWEKIFTDAITVTNGNTYTLSFDYSVEQNYTGYSGQFGLSVCTTSQAKYGADTDVITKVNFGTVQKSKSRTSVTFTATSNTIYLVANGGNINDGQENISFYISYIKLEEGSIATPWCPNSSDAFATTMGLNSTTEYDCSGFCNNGIRYGTFSFNSETPKYAVSTQYNGTDNTLKIPFNASVWPDNFTMSIWFRKDELGSKSYETLFGGPSGFEMDTRSGSSSSLSIYMASTRGGNVYTGIEFGKWYMVTLVNDGTNELYYINGELVKTIAKKSMPVGNYWIGSWNSATSQNYKGLISDARIYATALSASDVKSLYQNCATIDPDGTIRGQIRS